MSLERPFFQSFVEGDGEAFDRYISEKRRDGSWGDEPEIQALCELYDRPCEVWAYDAGMDPRKGGGARILRTFHAAAKGGSVMRLSYYGGGHYDSLVNDSDEFDPLADPGSCELLALQKARARKTNADASSALAVSDAEATERAAVEQALSASRAAYDGAADLEAALQASLSAQREAETSDLQSELDAAALRRAEDDDLARAIALSSDAAPQQGDADLAAAIDLSAADAAAGDDFLLAQALAASIEDT
jgi:OTU domain-containing protein 5